MLGEMPGGMRKLCAPRRADIIDALKPSHDRQLAVQLRVLAQERFLVIIYD
jgi:hypothetical protein